MHRQVSIQSIAVAVSTQVVTFTSIVQLRTLAQALTSVCLCSKAHLNFPERSEAEVQDIGAAGNQGSGHLSVLVCTLHKPALCFKLGLSGFSHSYPSTHSPSQTGMHPHGFTTSKQLHKALHTV